jgi:hypothetical protein
MGLPLSLAAIVLGVMGVMSINKTGKEGKGMAIAGAVIGGVAILLFLGLLAFGVAGALLDKRRF